MINKNGTCAYRQLRVTHTHTHPKLGNLPRKRSSNSEGKDVVRRGGEANKEAKQILNPPK